MATTSSEPRAGTVMAAGHGGRGKHGRGRAVGLIAAVGLSLAIGGLLGQGRQAAHEAAPQASTNPFVGDTRVYTMWDFREDRRAETRDLFAPDQFTYREDRRAEIVPVVTTIEERHFLEQNTIFLPGSAGAVTPDWETVRLIEQNALPEAPIVAPVDDGACAPGPVGICRR